MQVLDQGYQHPTTRQVSPAAILIYSFMRYKRSLEEETLPPVMVSAESEEICSTLVALYALRIPTSRQLPTHPPTPPTLPSSSHAGGGGRGAAVRGAVPPH